MYFAKAIRQLCKWEGFEASAFQGFSLITNSMALDGFSSSMEQILSTLNSFCCFPLFIYIFHWKLTEFSLKLFSGLSL